MLNRMSFLFFACCLIGILSSGAFSQTPDSSSTGEGPSVELGVAGGFPSAIGFVVGYWGTPKLPLVLRGTLGVGSLVDLGFYLPTGKGSNDKLFVAATGGVFGYFGILSSPLYNLGPTVGVHLGSFFAQGGPCMYFHSERAPKPADHEKATPVISTPGLLHPPTNKCAWRHGLLEVADDWLEAQGDLAPKRT